MKIEQAEMCANGTRWRAGRRPYPVPPRGRMNRKGGVRYLLGLLLLAVLLLQGADWPVAEAEPVKDAFSDELALRQWIVDKLAEREDMFTFRYTGAADELTDRLSRVMSQALNSDPFIRYNISRYSFHWKGLGDKALVTVYVQYRETLEQYQAFREETKRIVSERMPAFLNEAETVRWLHDYVVQRFSYDETMQSFSAYDAITTGSTVCQGYALVLQALFEDAGIPSIVVEGVAGDILHAWNMVQINGNWYHLDATWNDPVPDKPDRVIYSYFLLTDNEMEKDHSWDKLKTPAADHFFRPQLP